MVTDDGNYDSVRLKDIFTTIHKKVHFISIKPVSSDHPSIVIIFRCSIRRSHKTVLTVIFVSIIFLLDFRTVSTVLYVLDEPFFV
jgi:hypothetical protein